MSHGLVIASVERAADHGAALGVVAMVLLAIAVVGGLVYLVKGRRRSDRDPAGDRGPEASDRSPEA
jgi:hypothetical protein